MDSKVWISKSTIEHSAEDRILWLSNANRHGYPWTNISRSFISQLEFYKPSVWTVEGTMGLHFATICGQWKAPRGNILLF